MVKIRIFKFFKQMFSNISTLSKSRIVYKLSIQWPSTADWYKKSYRENHNLSDRYGILRYKMSIILNFYISGGP